MTSIKRLLTVRLFASVAIAVSASVILNACASVAAEDDKACYETSNRLKLLDMWYNDSKWNWSEELTASANPQQVALDLEKISLYDVSGEIRDAVWQDAQLTRAGRSALAMQTPNVCERLFGEKYDFNF
jgi:hypothetical protein